MKKLVFSILIALFAICASATTPADKLPAIVIDTMYVSSEALVVEYEVIRPFDHINLIVQPSWKSATRVANPVLLSGNTGKGKTSVPISLITDQAVHFNVFISGRQFANIGDTADYHPNGHDYAIFKKQTDNTIKQFRTQYTEEEKTRMVERIENIFIFPCKYV